MRTINSNLKADIKNGNIARLIKITCKNNTVYSFTDHDLPLTIDSVVYLPSAGLSSISYIATADVQVSSQQVGAAIIDVPETDLLGGVFDNAEIEASWCSWLNPAYGKVITFVGRIGELSWDETGFTAEVLSFMKQLEVNVGNVFTSSCRHQLFSSASPGRIGSCGLSDSTFTFAGSISSIDIPKWKFNITGISKPDGYFDNAFLTFTSGPNSGLSVTVKNQIGSNFELVLPSSFTLTPGNTFSVKAGCDKTLTTCKDKFNNVINFGGFPHINTDITFR